MRRSALKTNSQGFLVSSKQEINLKKFFIVQKEGSREVKREKGHYNLDVIKAIMLQKMM